MWASSFAAGQLSYSSAAAEADTLFFWDPVWTIQYRASPYCCFPLAKEQQPPLQTGGWFSVSPHFPLHSSWLYLLPPKPGPRTAAQAINLGQTPRQFQAMVIYGRSDSAKAILHWTPRLLLAVQTRTTTQLLPKEFPASFPSSVF